MRYLPGFLLLLLVFLCSCQREETTLDYLSQVCKLDFPEGTVAARDDPDQALPESYYKIRFPPGTIDKFIASNHFSRYITVDTVDFNPKNLRSPFSRWLQKNRNDSTLARSLFFKNGYGSYFSKKVNVGFVCSWDMTASSPEGIIWMSMECEH